MPGDLDINAKLFISILVPAVFSALMVLISCVAFASLIFSGRAGEFLALGITMLIFGALVVGLVYACISEYNLIVVQPDDDTAPIYAAMIAALVASLPLGVSGELLFWQVVLLILTTTVLSGLALVLLGQLNAGAVIEFLPYSVMGGYFATAGWLLTVGGVKSGSNVDISTLGFWSGLDGIDLGMVGATLIFALFLFAVRNHRLKNLWLVLSLLFGVSVFYLPLKFVDANFSSQLVERVTLGAMSSSGSVDFSAGMLLHAIKQTMGVNVETITAALPSFSIIILLSCVSSLLTISGLNLLLQQDTPANAELKKVGFANIIGGISGGMAAFPSVSLTGLSHAMGAPSTRWFAIATIISLAILGYFGLPWVGYIPKPVIGGLLLSLGLAFLYEWLIEARSRYLLHEYLVIPIILLVAIFFGFLQGVLIGLLAATILFVIKYSQTQVIRFEGDGRRFRSNVDRSADQLKVLQENGGQILVIGLQGYLFFGTAGRIYNRVKELLEENKSINYVLLDFEKVNGIDASAGLNFDKLSQLITLNKVYLLIAGLEDRLQGNLSSTGIKIDAVSYAHMMRDIDFALEWYEERTLAHDEFDQDLSSTFLSQLKQQDPDNYALFSAQLETIEVDAGHVLAQQGDASDALYLLDTCGASAYIDDGQGTRLRVRRVVAGAVYGEIGFFLGSPRTASIIVDEPGSIYVLTREKYERLECEHPEIIARLQRYLLGVSIERLLFTTQTLGTVMR